MKRIFTTLSFIMINFLSYGQDYKAYKIIQRQTDEILAIATCDKYFATASKDKSLFVLDYNGKKVFKYDVPKGRISALCFTSDSNYLLVAIKEIDSKGFERYIIKCFDVFGKVIKEFIDSTLTQEQVDLYYHEYTKGSQNAIVNLSKNFPELKIKASSNLPQVKSGLSHFEIIHSISISPNQQLIATIDYFRILKIWESSGRLLKTFQINNNKKNTYVYFTSDSTLYVTPNIALNINTGSSSYIGNYSDYMGIYLSNKIYYFFDYDQQSETEKLFDIQSNTIINIESKNMYSLQVSTSKDKFALLGVDGLIRIRNLEGELLSTFGNDRAEVITFSGRQIVRNSKIRRISFSNNGDYLISGDEEGKIIIWKAE